MTSLIKADLYRILHKKTLWILFVCTLAVSAAYSLILRSGSWNGFSYSVRQSTLVTGLTALLFGAALFISVYSDEFTARSMQAAIGRGLSRTKVIAAKIISCVIVSLILYAALLAYLLIQSRILQAGMTAEDTKILVLSVLKAAYCVAGYTPLAAVVIYLTDNKALSVFVEILLVLLLPGFMSILELSVLFANLHPSRYTLTGFANRGFTDLMLTGGGAGTLALGFAVYLAAAFALSVLVFCRRELDF